MADRLDEDRLETFFEAGRAAAPAPSGALMARILADGERLAPRSGPAQAAAAASRPGLRAGLRAVLGGWSVASGLATAALAGVWIGFAQPAPVASLTDTLLGSASAAETVDVLPDFADYLTEG